MEPQASWLMMKKPLMDKDTLRGFLHQHFLITFATAFTTEVRIKND
jgi:hypothetical protein